MALISLFSFTRARFAAFMGWIGGEEERWLTSRRIRAIRAVRAG
jgi:hypothetical protein